VVASSISVKIIQSPGIDDGAGGWTIVLDVGKTLSKAMLWDEAGFDVVVVTGMGVRRVRCRR
jgi:hypothetical protein